jgi:hypothetical protein
LKAEACEFEGSLGYKARTCLKKKKKKRKFHKVCPVRHFVVRVPLAFFREGSTGV